MKQLLTVVVVSLLLCACTLQAQSNSPATESQPKQLLETSAKQLAKASAEKGDTRLLYLPIRGNPIPGIAVEQKQAAINKCGSQPIKGFKDNFTADEKKDLLKKMAFAKQYNLVMIDFCFN
ncbi:hypothetical protein [Pelagibaculum spongiae]|uniref:Uncharacterized protein n=1 Tax=Pelagibaculum spongiae TaxID=2080658 RepID=A0A2V1H6A0_9GAMM|nr:hypothetical protein [Pelagibaculum spongiae]PVZ71952.1 hypothetical protein DC094_02710 [Pelagibaculum spongiae]